jgi:hypothetical protein
MVRENPSGCDWATLKARADMCGCPAMTEQVTPDEESAPAAKGGGSQCCRGQETKACHQDDAVD